MNRGMTIRLSIAFGVILVIVWAHIVDFDQMLKVLGSFDARLVFPLVILFILTYLLRSLRWKLILSPVQKISARQAFNLCMINYFVNFLIPLHGGEVVKSLLLKKLKETPISKSLVSIYIDKAADLIPIFLLIFLAPFLDERIGGKIYLVCGLLLPVVALVALTLVFFMYKKDVTLSFLQRILFFLPSGFKLKLMEFLDLLIEQISVAKRLWGKLFQICLLTFLALGVHCTFMWLFFLSFGVNLSAISAVVGYLLLNASFIFPAPPGFSGSLELTFLFIFSYLFGYDPNLVSAIAASSHVFIAILFTFFGFSALTFIGIRLSTILRAEQEGRMNIPI